MSTNDLNAKNVRLSNIIKNHSIYGGGYVGGLGQAS